MIPPHRSPRAALPGMKGCEAPGASSSSSSSASASSSLLPDAEVLKRVRTYFLHVVLPVRTAKPASIFLFGLLAGLLSAQLTVMNRDPVTTHPRATEPPHDTPEYKRGRVLQMFKHAWAGYRKHAWGHDELHPVSNSYNDRWGGFGMTIVDSLDTLVLLKMDDELAEARKHVEKIDWKSPDAGSLSVFEVTIRYLGGLLGAYTLTNDTLYLDQARALGDSLLPVFDTPSGAPIGDFNMHTGLYRQGRAICLAEVGSLQLEFSYLSVLTGDPVYATRANRFLEIAYDMKEAGDVPPLRGLFPLHFDPHAGEFTDRLVSFGGQGDSFYEYLLKLWLMDGKREGWLRGMYDESVEAMKRNLIFYTHSDNVVYLSAFDSGATHSMDHLSCFVPGMLALGAVSTADMKLAEGLAATCYKMYRSTFTGIGAEVVSFAPNEYSFATQDARYQLRPEALESMFVLWRLTKNQKYRDWAWDMFLAIERNCKTETAYSGLLNVDLPKGGDMDDRMESFFIAETVKYLYLIFSDDDAFDFNKYVLSTEAHPFLRQT